MRNSAFYAQIWFLSAELILSILLLGATGTYIAFRPELWSPFNGLAAYAGLTLLYTATYLTVLCVTQISWFTSMVADALFQGILCAGGPVCLGFAIKMTLDEMQSLDRVNINAAVVIFIGLALALVQWLHLWIKVTLVLVKCGGSWTVWKQSFCNLMDRNQPRDLSFDDFLIVNDHNGKRISETEPIYGDAFDERIIETPPRLSISTMVEDKDWLRSKYTMNEKSPASTAPVLQYEPFPCTTLDFDVPVIDKPGSPLYTMPASFSNHRYSSESLPIGSSGSTDNLASMLYVNESRRQSVASFDQFSPRNSGEYQRPSFDIYRSNSGNTYRLVDGARPPSLDLHRVDAAIAHPTQPQPAAQIQSMRAQRPAFDIYQEQEDMGSSDFSHDPASTLYDHTPAQYEHAPAQYDHAPAVQDRRRSPPNYDQRRSPPNYDQRRSPPNHDQRRSPPNYDQRRSPPSHDQRRSPPSHDQRRSPPSHDQRTSPPQEMYIPPQGMHMPHYDPTLSPRYAEPPSQYDPSYDHPSYDHPAFDPSFHVDPTSPSHIQRPALYDAPARYEAPTAPRGRRQSQGPRPKSYHGHGAHPPVARSKSYVEPYEAGPPPARSKSYGHGGAYGSSGHGQEPQAQSRRYSQGQDAAQTRRYSQSQEPPAQVRRYSQDNGRERRWSSSSYTSLPRVPSMLRHSEVSDSAVE